MVSETFYDFFFLYYHFLFVFSFTFPSYHHLGMERGDLLEANGQIFKQQGSALNANANRDTLKCLVVGNPANTNAMIAASFAPELSPRQFNAMTMLDHNRGLGLLADQTGAKVEDIDKFAIWGNHSPTMYPDISHASIGGKDAASVVNDQEWYENHFTPRVQKRGAEIIEVFLFFSSLFFLPSFS